MKILIIQHKNLTTSGGTEKICCFLANSFFDLGHEVEIATNENVNSKPAFYLNENVSISNIYSEKIEQIKEFQYKEYKGNNPLLWIKYKLLKKQTKFKNKKLLEQIGGKEKLYKFNLANRAKTWKLFIEEKNPDVIITMSIESLLEITYLQNYTIPIINSTNGRPDYDYSDILWYRSEFEMNLLMESYKNLSGIQILFENYKEFLPKTFQGEIMVIPNPVPQPEESIIKIHTNLQKKLKIINIATLSVSCKQQDIAIEIFSKIEKKFPNWELHFWGTGNDFDYLNTTIKKYNLQNSVFLNGYTSTPLDKLKDADIYIFPSKYEGFPLSLTEAMGMGLPSIGFSSCSGVNQLIKHGENGFLANNSEELKDYLIDLIENSELRQKMGNKGHLFVKKYKPENISTLWNTNLIKIVECKSLY